MPDFTSGPATPLYLEQEDFFLLITDGFVEWANPQEEEFGHARLKQAIRDSRHLSPEQILKSLYDAVLTFSNGTKQMDDLTAVIIKRI